MKIGIVLASVPGYSETFFTSKIKGLQAKGFEVILFVNKYSSNTSLNCQIITAPKFSKNKLKNIFITAFQLIKSLAFNYKSTKNLYYLDKKDGLSFSERIKGLAINSHLLTKRLNWLHFGFGTMAIGRENVACAIGARMAVSFRGYDHYVYPLKNQGCYRLLFLKKVNYHVLSEAMKCDLIQQNCSFEKIVKITPAINLELFSNKIKKESKLTFITVARLHWIKGLSHTLEALSILHRNGIGFTYTIIGDGIEMEHLQFIVHQLGLTDKVHFLGQLSPNEVRNQLASATYYLQYSLQEGFCNSVLEAQAMGLLCIVSDADGLMENVIDQKTGWIVPKRKPQLLANKIQEVIALPASQKNKIVTAAIERIKLDFNVHKQIKQFVDFYK